MSKNNLKKVPYYNGEPVWYDGYQADEYRANKPFEATMRITYFSRGCSSAKMVMENEFSRQFETFLKDAPDIIRKVADGVVRGTFCFVKRGRNFGIKLYDKKDNKL